MINLLWERLRQGYRTSGFPKTAPVLPERYAGRPVLDTRACAAGCRKCVESCPSGALGYTASGLTLDMGRCLFCRECVDECPAGAVTFTNEYRMAVSAREDLILGGGSEYEYRLAGAMRDELRRVLGRSFRLRQVSAGGCGACEADVNVLGTVVFDLARFGIDFVASPRHADGLLITGPVTKNMELALKKTYEATPAPKIVIASGACAISGGPYAESPEVLGGAGSILKVDLFIPGCPPHPFTILDGLLRLLARV